MDYSKLPGCENSWKAVHAALLDLFSDPVFEKYQEHMRDTPRRLLELFGEYFAGMLQNPEEVLRTGFLEETYSEMIHLEHIPLISVCAHHVVPFIGEVHFAYLPDKRIVGLSKIPRMIEIFAKRPQVQERLTNDIVQCFQQVVQPKGCGAIIRARHLCVEVRGIKRTGILTKTTSLAGCFQDAEVKMEFLRKD